MKRHWTFILPRPGHLMAGGQAAVSGHSVTLASVSLSDAGVYVCTATNQHSRWGPGVGGADFCGDGGEMIVEEFTLNLSSSPVSRRIEVEVELEPRVELEEVFLHTQVSLGGLCHLSPFYSSGRRRSGAGLPC